ncbi:MAG TPA: thermonuclease family protein [Longimicrobiales bacterium]|nr:thermonuclease family protein [Longimicrobiales bacterium]
MRRRDRGHRAASALAYLLAVVVSLATLLPTTLRAQAPAPPADARYAASAQGRVYYWIGCTSRWGRLSPRNIIFFLTADAAEGAGYTPSRSQGCGRKPESVPTPAVRLPLAGRRAPDAPRRAPDAARFAGTCVIARIVDGDTVTCVTGERIRLLLIDAPELSQAPFGLRSRQALQALLPPGTAAVVELDVQHGDRYGRILAHLYTPDGVRVTEEMVRQGYAVVAVYPPNVRYVERFRAAAEEAMREGRGLWAGSGFDCLPAERRRGVCEI